MTATVFAWDTDSVPRRPPSHEADTDEWAAWRVGYERERHGWSQGELARQMTAAGVPMQQQNIWRIETGKPPRKISYGEAVAFCKVFDLDDMADLGRPPAEVASDVVAEIKELREEWRGAADRLIEQLRYIRLNAHADPDIWRQAVEDLRWYLLRIEQEIAEVKSELEIDTPGPEEQEEAEREATEYIERQLRDRAKRDTP